MIEYVLLLIISVSMVLMAKSLFSGMGKFMDGYMGNYVRCLMEHGELPAFGAQNPDINKNSTTSYICAKQFSYSVSTGFSPNGTDGSGGRGGGSGSSSNSNSNSNKSSNSTSSSNRNRSGEDTSSSASNGSTSGSSEDSIAGRERKRKSKNSRGGGEGVAGSTSGFKSGRSGTADGDDGISSSSQPRVIAELGKGDAKSSLSDSEMGRGGRSRRYVTGISGKLAEEIEKNSKSAQTSSKLKNAESRIISESESTLEPQRSFVKRLERKVAVEQEEEKTAFSMGQFFKYILIIALIIVIVIFFGGQLLNYSKSD